MLPTWLELVVDWSYRSTNGAHYQNRTKTMTNKTRALGRRIIGALRNENVMVITSTSLHSVTLCNAKTQKAFLTVSTDDVQDFEGLLYMIRTTSAYPAPKERKVYAQPKIRHTQTTAVSMGRFIPGNLSAISEGM